MDLGRHELNSFGAAFAVSLTIVHHAAKRSSITFVVRVVISFFHYILLISSGSTEVAHLLLLEVLLFHLVVLQNCQEGCRLEFKSPSLGCLDAPPPEVWILQFLLIPLLRDADLRRMFIQVLGTLHRLLWPLMYFLLCGFGIARSFWVLEIIVRVGGNFGVHSC
jgi:hypothetical protein